MRHIWQFLKEVGGWAIASELAAVVFFAIGLWEHFQDRAVSSFVFVCLAVSLCLIGAYVSWKKKHDEILELRRRTSEVPRIRKKKDGFKHDGRQFGTQQICSLVVQFENTPQFHCDSAVARHVIAKLKYFNIDVEQNPRFLFEFDGRWATNEQPIPGQANKNILTTDIQIGETVELDLAVRYLEEEDAYAVNNESFQYSLKNPIHKLPGQRFLVKVRLMAVNVDENFEFRFENLGKYNYLAPLTNN